MIIKKTIKERKALEKLVSNEIKELSIANMEKFKKIDNTDIQAVCKHIVDCTNKHLELSIKLFECRRPLWAYNF